MSKREAAVALATKGFRVFPCAVNGKVPVIANFHDLASSDPTKVREWWTEATGESRHNNIGVSTDDLLVLDFDVKNGAQGIKDSEELDALLEFAHMVETPTGGYHAYLRLPEGKTVANTAKKIGKATDTRSWHGYVLGAGSEIDGVPYQWVESADNTVPASRDELAEAPQWLIEKCGAPKQRESASTAQIEWDSPSAIAAAKSYLANAEGASVGARGSTAYKVAARVRDFAVSEAQCLELLLEHWNVEGRVYPVMPLTDLAESVDHAYRYAKNKPHEPGSEFDPVYIEPKKDPPNPDWPSPALLDHFDPTSIPKREWIVPGLLARTFLTGLIAPSGAGKTQWMAQLMLAITANRPQIIGSQTVAKTNIWAWNQEDDLNELKRRLGAALMHFGIKWEDVSANLFLNTGVERPLLLVARDANGSLRETKHVKAMIRHMVEKRIGVLIIDPLVEFHQADENNNVEMRLVAAALRRIAVEANAGVMLGHHTKKPDGARSDGFAGNADSGRGASALQGVTRIMATLYAMSERDAKAFGVPIDARHKYVRLDGAKSNISAATGDARPTWFERTGQQLGLEGESVGVLTPVELARSRVERMPDLFRRVERVMIETAMEPDRWHKLSPIAEQICKATEVKQTTFDQWVVTLEENKKYELASSNTLSFIKKKGAGGTCVQINLSSFTD